MVDFIIGSWGFVLSHVVVFAAGAWMGKPLFSWLNSKLPWTLG